MIPIDRGIDYNTIQKIWAQHPRAVVMAMLPPPTTKPITLPYSVVLAGRKDKSKLSHILKGEQ